MSRLGTPRSAISSHQMHVTGISTFRLSFSFVPFPIPSLVIRFLADPHMSVGLMLGFRQLAPIVPAPNHIILSRHCCYRNHLCAYKAIWRECLGSFVITAAG